MRLTVQKHMKSSRTISSREFNQDIGKAKRAAEEGPVVITDRGKPAYVLMRHDEYRRLAEPEKKETLFDLLAQNEPEADFDFDPPRLSDDMGLRIPDFSKD
jgi:prevent-host-death family protein